MAKIGESLDDGPFRDITAIEFPAVDCSITSAPGFRDGVVTVIMGVRFGAAQGTGKVELDDGGTPITQTVNSWSDTAINVTAETTAFGHPSGSTPVTLTVTVNGGAECEFATVNIVGGSNKTVTISAGPGFYQAVWNNAGGLTSGKTWQTHRFLSVSDLTCSGSAQPFGAEYQRTRPCSGSFFAERWSGSIVDSHFDYISGEYWS